MLAERPTTAPSPGPCRCPGTTETCRACLRDIRGVDVLDAIPILEIELELADDESLHPVGAHADIIQEHVPVGPPVAGQNVSFLSFGDIAAVRGKEIRTSRPRRHDIEFAYILSQKVRGVER